MSSTSSPSGSPASPFDVFLGVFFAGVDAATDATSASSSTLTSFFLPRPFFTGGLLSDASTGASATTTLVSLTAFSASAFFPRPPLLGLGGSTTSGAPLSGLSERFLVSAITGSGTMSSAGSLSGEALIASGASMISLFTSGLTTAAGGFLAGALRLGCGASPFAVASTAADCLRFAAGMVSDAMESRLIVIAGRNRELMRWIVMLVA
jgi:hypothetical protein